MFQDARERKQQNLPAFVKILTAQLLNVTLSKEDDTWRADFYERRYLGPHIDWKYTWKLTWRYGVHLV